MTGKPTDAELAELTDEERAGLLEHEAEDATAAAEGAKPEGEAAAAAGEVAAAGAVVADAAAGEGKEAEKPVAEQTEADKAAQARDEQGRFAKAEAEPVPLIKGGDVAGAKARIEAIGGETEGLEKRFEDGEITAREYREGLRKLNDETAELRWQVQKSALAGEVEQSRQEERANAWYAGCEAYLGDHPELTSTTLRATAFDAAVRRVNGDPQTGKLPQVKQLELAREMWTKELGLDVAAAPAAKTTPAAEPGKGVAPPAARVIPPTLGKVPAAEMSETGSEFATLERMAEEDPEAYMSALEAMKPADLARYRAGA